MGADNYFNRRRGPWLLDEVLQMFTLVCKATGIQILRQSRKVTFKEGQTNAKQPYQLVENEVIIYDQARCKPEDIIPFLIKEKRAKKHLRSIDFVVSWKSIAEALKTRSVDDIRNYWAIKILPMFDPDSQI